MVMLLEILGIWVLDYTSNWLRAGEIQKFVIFCIVTIAARPDSLAQFATSADRESQTFVRGE